MTQVNVIECLVERRSELSLGALRGEQHEDPCGMQGIGEVFLDRGSGRPAAVHPRRDAALPKRVALPLPALHSDGHHRHCVAPQESSPPCAAPCVEGGAGGAEGGDLAG